MEKPERNAETLTKEYTQLCTKLGHLNHQIESFRRESNLVLDSMRDLEFEFTKMHQKEQQEAAAKTAEASTTTNVVPLNSDAAQAAAN